MAPTLWAPPGVVLGNQAGSDRGGVPILGNNATPAPIVGVPIVEHRALQMDLWRHSRALEKLRRELASRPPRRYQPQPDDSWD